MQTIACKCRSYNVIIEIFYMEHSRTHNFSDAICNIYTRSYEIMGSGMFHVKYFNYNITRYTFTSNCLHVLIPTLHSKHSRNTNHKHSTPNIISNFHGMFDAFLLRSDQELFLAQRQNNREC